MLTYQRLEAVISRGVKDVEYHDIFPSIQKTIDEGIEIDGQKYGISIPAYRMATIIFATPIKKGSAGYSFVVGRKQGKLFIVGWKRLPE